MAPPSQAQPKMCTMVGGWLIACRITIGQPANGNYDWQKVPEIICSSLVAELRYPNHPVYHIPNAIRAAMPKETVCK